MIKMSTPMKSKDEPKTLSPTLARERVAESLKKRHRNEGRFLSYGRVAIITALLFLVILFGSILSKGNEDFVCQEFGPQLLPVCQWTSASRHQDIPVKV